MTLPGSLLERHTIAVFFKEWVHLNLLPHGLRRRKNCGLFVAGMATDLLVPSSVTLALLVTQVVGGASVPACSNAKVVVSIDGQETITSVPERRTESVGRTGR